MTLFFSTPVKMQKQISFLHNRNHVLKLRPRIPRSVISISLVDSVQAFDEIHPLLEAPVSGESDWTFVLEKKKMTFSVKEIISAAKARQALLSLVMLFIPR